MDTWETGLKMANQTSGIDDWTTIRDACGRLGLSRVRVAQFCRAGRMAGAVRLGRMWAIPRGSLEAFALLDRPPGRPRVESAPGKSPLQ